MYFKSILPNFSSNFSIPSISLLPTAFELTLRAVDYPLALKLLNLQTFPPWYSIAFLYYFKAFSKGKHVNLVCFIILLSSEGSISSPERYSYLSILTDNKADVLAASWNFSSLILSSTAMIILKSFSKRFFLKYEELSDVKVASTNKKFCSSFFF